MRTFIAVELDDAIRERLGQAQDRLREAPCKVKWVRPAQMHVTLKFLGEIDPAVVDDVAKAMAWAAEAAEPCALRVAGLGTFPPRGAPRVVWAGIEDASGMLGLVHKRLARALEPMGFEPEKRAFRPHLTLGRVKERSGTERLRDLLAGQEGAELGTQDVSEIVLFQSVLSPQGATYTALRRVTLGGPAHEG